MSRARPHIVVDGVPICPEAAERDAMSDGEFWERVAIRLGVNVTPDELEDGGGDFEVVASLDGVACGVCGESGACGYDMEGRAMIHTEEDDE